MYYVFKMNKIKEKNFCELLMNVTKLRCSSHEFWIYIFSFVISVDNFILSPSLS